MKVTCNRAFAPVTIVLESQDEVDELHSWANHAVVSPTDAPLGRLHAFLREHVSNGALDRYNQLNQRIQSASRI